ncbi:MAG: ribosome maturation factor RimP [Deltaproteobacteria bacterium]|nr:ribosome maturation factor RimP [Deltaproteobacteria bacterium]
MTTNGTTGAQEAQIWSILEPVISAQDFELIEVELTHDRGRKILRLYIDHPDRAISIDDTTLVTRLVDPVLDVEDPIEGAYYLEVSSPGLDRPLRLAAHFERFVGERVKIRTEHPVSDGRRRNFNGILKGIRDGQVTVDVDGELFEFPHADIVRARLEYRFDEENR